MVSTNLWTMMTLENVRDNYSHMIDALITFDTLNGSETTAHGTNSWTSQGFDAADDIPFSFSILPDQRFFVR